MVSGDASLFLTQKGTEELRSRAHKLDFAARNILFLIERGSTSTDAILRRSVFPRDKVIDKLSRLMSNEFVAVGPGDDGRLRRPAEMLQPPGELLPRPGEMLQPPGELLRPPGEMPREDYFGRPVPEPAILEDGISVAQARFVLSDFCLDHLGEPGTELTIAIKRCSDVVGLQSVLDRICRVVRDRCRERLPKLQGCVREINLTNI